MRLDDIEDLISADFLTVLGGFHPHLGEPGFPKATATLLMIGPKEPGFWPHVTAQSEWQDGCPDPVDRWSRRVIGSLACRLGAKALFPFSGPPWHPFYQWALRTGRLYESPVRLLVHDQQGLMVSFRGALALKQHLALPPSETAPCEGCAAPCLTACPGAALGADGYDVPACHRFLESAAGQPCLQGDCLVRRACPLASGYARLEEQSAYHMRRFHI